MKNWLEMNSPIHQAPDNKSEAIRHWFADGLGFELLEAEQRVIDRLPAGLYGVHLAQVGIDPLHELTAASSITHKFVVYPQLLLGMQQHSIIAENTELPLEHNSVDVIVLHHALDFTTNPHQVLREAARVIRPGGHILIVGFNPFSWWGVRRRLARKHSGIIWQKAHFISHRRLIDWIKLLELTELRTMSDYFLPPYLSASVRRRFSALQTFGRNSLPGCGAFYAVLVRKDLGGMMIANEKRFSRRFIRLPVAEPATRGHVCENR